LRDLDGILEMDPELVLFANWLRNRGYGEKGLSRVLEEVVYLKSIGFLEKIGASYNIKETMNQMESSGNEKVDSYRRLVAKLWYNYIQSVRAEEEKVQAEENRRQYWKSKRKRQIRKYAGHVILFIIAALSVVYEREILFALLYGPGILGSTPQGVMIGLTIAIGLVLGGLVWACRPFRQEGIERDK